MNISQRPDGRVRRRRSAGTALLGAAVAAVLGFQIPAQAAAPEAPKPPAVAASNPAAFEPACAAAKQGDATCFALRRTDVNAGKGLRKAAPGGYGPEDLHSAYNLPATGGRGQTIAIVDAYDDPTAEADLAVYREQFGLSACTTANGCFTKIDQRGGTDYPQADPSWAAEISLDLDMVSAVAPDAHILLVEADDSSFANLGAAVDQAVARGAKFVSNSYGTDYRFGSGEDPYDLTVLDAFYNHPGVAMVASSGDFGHGVSYPAASRYVTSVGGTSLRHDSSTARGWSESAWDGAGSGCSLYQPKPAFQKDTGCTNRAVSDVSAVADPGTPVAVYQSFGGGGWSQFGGTSAGAPIIAAVYAAAGTPAEGTYPNAYPYEAEGGGLFDVTSGSNGTCTPEYLCTGTAGYDGPTGLGTPDGLRAFRTGPHGKVSGTVIDEATGTPLAGSTVTAGSGNVTHTGSDGGYSFTLPPGTYDITVAAFGYADATVKDVSVAEDGTVTEDFALQPVPSRTVSGKVTDGSGHGWPLYARITVDGVPGGPTWTDPVTGAFSLDLPKDHDYTLHAEPALPGYTSGTRSFTVGEDPTSLTLSVPADRWKATAPGYAVDLRGATEHFDSTEAAPQGWSVVNAADSGGTWSFDDPGGRGNGTGGSGAFASIGDGSFTHLDSHLVSPEFDLTGVSDPELAFGAAYWAYGDDAISVEATSDDGAHWKKVWNASAGFADHAKVEIPLTDYAGKPAVRVRFHFATDFAWSWDIDEVFVGQRDYKATPGGLVAGEVNDTNTGAGLTGATVSARSGPAATTVATPEDPSLGDGFYLLFSPDTGKRDLTADKYRYTSLSKTVQVSADSTVRAPFDLKAGQLTLTPAAVDATVGWGASVTRKITVKNTGTAPATVRIGERAGTFSAQAVGAGAPVQTVKGHISLRPTPVGAATKERKASGGTVTSGPSGDAWQSAPDLPETVYGNAAGTYEGKVYSAFGETGLGLTNKMYFFDPVVGTWAERADAADARLGPSGQFIDGKFYVVGGLQPNTDSNTDTTLEIYDPVKDAWSKGTPAPEAYALAGNASLDGKLYTIGGCASRCGTAESYAYDPDTDTWSRIADYPERISWESCAGVNGKLYCAGGNTDIGGETKHAYSYDPITDAWTALPDMPVSMWGSAYAAANDRLVISSGVSADAITNRGYAFDPEDGSWTALPNANTATYYGGAGLGFYKVGGAAQPFTPVGTVELLPGWDQGNATDVTWLRTDVQQFTLAVGASRTVVVTLDASVPEVAQPGDFTATLTVDNDTPYGVRKLPVSVHVDPPKTWGKITGTVRGVQGDGSVKALAGATVEISSWAADYSLRTAADGTYSLWLDTRNNPLGVIAAKDGYRPVGSTVKLKKGAAVTSDYTLKKQ